MASTFFEQSLGLERAELIARSLEAQVDGYGVLDVPLLSRELRPYTGGNVLDIGTGNGSFLFKVAATNHGVQFVGVEHDSTLLSKAQSTLADLQLPNVRLRQAFFDSEYADKHDVIFTRFTLQHSSSPQEFLGSALRSLNPGGMFVAIEPIYDYYDSELPDPVWQDFRRRMFATYERWGSNPNVPKHACRWLTDAGFASVRVAIHMYSPITIGANEFAAAILTTIAALRFDYPDLWDLSFLRRIEDWIVDPAGGPYVAIAHIVGFTSWQHIR